MQRKLLKTLSFTLFAVFLIALMGTHALPEELAPIVSSGHVARTASHIWTAEEMAAAVPMPLPTVSGEPRAPSEVLQPTGEPGSIPGAPPADDVTTPVLGQSEGEEVYLGEIDPLGYSYPYPFTRYEVFPAIARLYKFYPYKTIGRLYFKQNGTSYVCSASSIGNAGVWTAGHCVSDGSGTWSTDVVFVPASFNNSSPLGQWQYSSLWTFTAWHTGGDFGRDSGGVVVYDINYKGGTYRLGPTVGYLGFAWNWPRDTLHWHAIGYPAASPFDGRRQIVCAASDAFVDNNFSPATIGIGCDQTGGTSGGPWIKNFSSVAGAANYLNGNQSYKYVSPSQPLAIYGPYLDTSSKTLWDAIVGDEP